MKNRSTHHSGPIHACLEITGTSLHLAVYRPSDLANKIKTRTIRWRHEARGIASEYGPQELSSALFTLVSEEDLQDAELHLSLGGEYCITRHVSGATREVTDRISELEVQCRRFLLLGEGQKLAASTIVETESGDFRGLVSAFNRQVLQVILDVARRMNLNIKEVNSSAVLLAGIVGSLSENMAGGLVIRLQENQVDLLLVDQGIPLLDVRPAQKLNIDDLGKFVAERHALLRRFYGTHSLTARRDLNVVYVSGEAEVPEVRKQLLDLGLSVQVLSHELESVGWGTASDADLTICNAPLGAFCGILPNTKEGSRPDLLSVMAGTETESLKTRLVQTLWPAVAAALLCMMFQTMSNAERKVATYLDQAVVLFEKTQGQIDDLDYEVNELTDEAAHLATISKQAEEVEWNQIIGQVAACMPVESNLDGWIVNNDRTVQLRGRCSRDETVYQFVEYVSRLPQIKRAELAATKTATGAEQDGVQFDVVVELRPANATHQLARSQAVSDSLRR